MKNSFWAVIACVVVGGCQSNSGTTQVDSDASVGDSGSDADTDSDADSDAGTEKSFLPLTDCDGGIFDPNSKLCWQEEPTDSLMSWKIAKDYCRYLEQGGQTNWRLPSIQELVSLIRGCKSNTCGVSYPGCNEKTCAEETNCSECEELTGPGPAGCFWDMEMKGSCEVEYRTSSPIAGEPSRLWCVSFKDGRVFPEIVGLGQYTRCVYSDKKENPNPAEPMTDCGGGKLDPNSGLCWQDPPNSVLLSQEQATEYCKSLVMGEYDDWRLPEISELVSLLRGCVNGVDTGGLNLSNCGLLDPDCFGSICSEGIDCEGCYGNDGPDENGCYWDPALTGSCESVYTTVRDASEAKEWTVAFYSGYIYSTNNLFGHTRCVR